MYVKLIFVFVVLHYVNAASQCFSCLDKDKCQKNQYVELDYVEKNCGTNHCYSYVRTDDGRTVRNCIYKKGPADVCTYFKNARNCTSCFEDLCNNKELK